MDELMRLALITPDDVVAARRLTLDVAREVGMARLVQTKLATVVSGLARRSLASAGAGEVVFSVATDAQGAGQLLVSVCDAGPSVEGTDSVPASRSARWRAPKVDLTSLRPLVGTFELATEPGGGNRVTTTVQLPTEVVNDHFLIRRLAALRPSVPPALVDPPSVDSAGFLDRLEAQTRQLEMARAELTRVNGERLAVNSELALTNRGVLDLVAELSAANESLTISGVGFRQLADQQSALADLGHRAVASRDLGLLALGLVGILRRVLGIQAVGVLRFDPGESGLEVIASEGCEPDQPTRVGLGSDQARSLRRTGTLVADPTEGKSDFPLLVPWGSRSTAVVAVHTPVGPWGVLVACDTEEERFTGTTTAFLEAAVSLFAFAIARMASEEATQHAAFHDVLTGLPNRAQLLDHLARALDDHPPHPSDDHPARSSGDHSARSSGDHPPRALDDHPARSWGDHPARAEAGQVKPEMAVIFIDIDGFKQVNDTIGHAAGDRVLVEATARLRSRTRPSDILSRLGGDEFVALCEGGAEAAAVIAKRLLSAFDDPFVVEGREMFLSASAGLALAQAGLTSEEILADADIAMYQAKQTPGSASVAFHPEMRAMAESESRLHNELRRALERGQLRAVYQPVVNLCDGTVSGVETLLRWRHPDLGDVPAQRAVAAAERIGLAWDFTCWIAAEAAGVVSAWNAVNVGHPPLRLAVNFTPLLLGDPDGIAEFAAHVTGAGLPFDLLDVELTETAFADPTPAVLASMAELRRRGARLAMDDFGTGYSSLVALARLPLDILKIDRYFVSSLDSGGDTLLVSAMTAIGRGRNLETIGEGIETEGQLVELINAGCDLGQGYLFARPLEREQLEGLGSLESHFVDAVRVARLEASGPATPHAFLASGDARPLDEPVVEDDQEVV